MFYYLAILGLKIYLNLKFKIKVIGKENIPKKGAVIFCANHLSNFDPVVVCISINRKIRYLAKKKLFNTKFKNYWMRQLEAYPIDTETNDVEALKFAINHLKNKGALGIFAQGTRVKKKEDEMQSKNGVSLLAIKGGALVVPIGISATYENKSEVIVNIGKAISFEEYKNKKIKTDVLNEMTEKVMQEIKNLIIEK